MKKFMSRKKIELKPETILKLHEIFIKKDWEIEDDNLNQVSLFNRFSSLLSELTSEEQELVLELTNNFTRIKPAEYEHHIQIAINNFLLDQVVEMDEINRVYIAPLIAPVDFGKVKSSGVVQYLCRSVINYIPEFGSKKIIYIDASVNGLNIEKEHINKQGRILLLVDDFVGTGETACSAVDYLINDKEIEKEKLIVLSIASLNQGVDCLAEQGIHNYSSLTFDKGITDNCLNAEEVAKKIKIMESIERKIKVKERESLGYNKSEALITLIRTPNNTFPVFWKEKGGRVAPFPRH